MNCENHHDNLSCRCKKAIIKHPNDDRKLIVDATGHVAGKLAANVAKKLLEGFEVYVVSCENAILTGPLERRIGKYKSWKNKRCIVNPMRGAFSYKEPSKFFFKILRTMVRRKSNRGGEALRRLECYDSIPNQFLCSKKIIFPNALHSITCDPERKISTIGELLGKFGWKYNNLSKKIVTEFYTKEQEELQSRNTAINNIVNSAEFQQKVDNIISTLK